MEKIKNQMSYLNSSEHTLWQTNPALQAQLKVSLQVRTKGAMTRRSRRRDAAVRTSDWGRNEMLLQGHFSREQYFFIQQMLVCGTALSPPTGIIKQKINNHSAGPQ